MKLGDLELFATKDLINELLRRETFQGVIVHTLEEAKNHDWNGERLFVVRHNASLGTEEAGRLLDVVSQYIANRE
jgi:hypothetical protein